MEEIDNYDLTQQSKRKSLDLPSPKCPKCGNHFNLNLYEENSPIMSMSCGHTICFSCTQLSVESNRKKLKRPYIQSANCPVKNCLSKNAFRFNSEHWNMSLINYANQIRHFLNQS